MRRVVSGQLSPNLTRLFRGKQEGQDIENGFLAAVYEDLATQSISEGENFFAYEFSHRGEELAKQVGFPLLRLKQLQALALNRGGAPHRANQILRELETGGATDAETIGMLARTYRDFATSTTDEEMMRQFFREAFLLARQGFEENRSYYNGIQAAQFCLLMGDRLEATALATQVENLCRKRLDQGVEEKELFWLMATIAESFLIRGLLNEARAALIDVLKLGEDRPAEIGAILRVWRMILKEVTGDSSSFDEYFFPLIPPIIAFSGHLIDAPDRRRPRFTESMVSHASEELAAFVARENPRGGFCQGACGADLLLAEALLEFGHEVYLVLPFSIDETRKISIEPAGRAWVERFDRVLDSAHTIKKLRLSARTASSTDYAYANTVMCGLARLKAKLMESRVIPSVLWDELEEGDAGGTWDFVNYWRQAGMEPQIISTRKLR